MRAGLRRGWTRLRELGAREAARRAGARLEARAWDRYFGVNTDGFDYDRSGYGDSGHHVHYEPLPWQLLRRAVGALSLGPTDVFLDLGSGLGRVLMMAARRPLKRVLGVEFMAPLAERSRENLRRCQRRLRSPVEVVIADASKWEVPDDVSVVLLFNPFVGDVMAAVQRNLEASLTRSPRRLQLLYAHANDQPNLFADCAWLRLDRRLEVGAYREMNLLVYER